MKIVNKTRTVLGYSDFPYLITIAPNVNGKAAIVQKTVFIAIPCKNRTEAKKVVKKFS